jgi:hypothetical protein
MSKETYQIFLSSTSVDLKLYRDKVREFIERLRLTTIRMETFGARPNLPFKTCELEVKECDALIVIVGKRYGWVPGVKDGGDGIKSITWWEVKWALEAGKPVYAFLCDQKQVMNLESEQDRLIEAKTEKEFIEIGNAVSNLVKFRTFLDGETTRETFNSVDDLAAKVTSSLQDWVLKIAIENAKTSYSNERSIIAPAFGHQNQTTTEGELHNYEQLYWQEQIRWTSAKCIFQNTESDSEIGIAIIAGKANLNHPTLAEVTGISQFDMRNEKSTQRPDDYTTAIAALLTGKSVDDSNYKGMLPNIKLSVFQVLSDTYSATDSILLAAIDAAIIGGNKIICLSLGGTSKSVVYEKVFERVHDLGVIMVCAAGNEATNNPSYPASYPHCIAVASLDSSNILSDFSNYGEWVTTSAPGEDIPTAEGSKYYNKGSGTTFACTIATAVVALMLYANKDLNPDEVKEILKTTGSPVYDKKGNKMSFSQIDTFKAVQAALKMAKGNKKNVAPKKDKISRTKESKK